MKVILTIVLRLIVLTQTPHHCMQSTAFFYQMSSLFIGGLDPLFSSANSEKKLNSDYHRCHSQKDYHYQEETLMGA